MATSRPFKYNPSGTPISGTLQVGSVSVALGSIDFSGGGWWNGADEELGYVICKPVPLDNQDTPVPGDDLTISGTYKGVDVALSNNNQTAYQQFGYQMTGLGETLISGTDLIMFSIYYTTLTPTTLPQSRFIGVGKTTMNYQGNPYGGYPGNDDKSIGFNAIGEYYYNGNVVSSGLPTWGDGDTIDVAISHGQYWWIRVNGGNWNNNPSANPATLTGGLTMNGQTNYYPALCPGYEGTMRILNVPPYGYPSGYNFLGHTTASISFLRSADLTDASFVELVNSHFNQNILTAKLCKDYLTANGYWTSWGNLPAGMVLYLDAGISSSYSGTGSTWYDLSGNGNHGTINGAAYSSSQGGVFEFDGINDNISFSSVSNIPIGNEPYTISVWFKSDEMPSDRGFVGWGEFGSTNQVNAWRLRNSGGLSGFRHYWWGNDLDYNTPMNTTTWYNAVAAYENGTRNLYLNNVLVASDTPSGHNVQSAANLRIGVTAESLNEWFDGQIGQVVIYKRQASVAEVSAIYNSGLDRFV